MPQKFCAYKSNQMVTPRFPSLRMS
jgi:hypothetical protein